MKTAYGVSGLFAAVFLVACGQGGGGRDAQFEEDGGVPDAGAPDAGAWPEDLPPAILTRHLQPVVIGRLYIDKITVQGGSPPFTWSLLGRPAELSWLEIDPAQGMLTGLPPVLPRGDRNLDVQVRDSSEGGRTAFRRFAVRIDECDDGASADCFVPSTQACMQGIKTCADGAWTPCSNTRGSTGMNTCGASCGPCGPGALHCENGRCACGSGAACSGTTPVCCGTASGGSCVNLAVNPDSCGACGVSCDAGVRQNVVRVCDGGVCDFPCVGGQFADCDGSGVNGCEANLNSSQTCGSCTRFCQAPDAGTATCTGGTCGQICPIGFNKCPPTSNTGTTCHSQDNPNHCGGCGRVCSTALANVASGSCDGGTCHLVCALGTADCDADWTSGCETPTQTDRLNCGGCGIPCSGSFDCIDGVCVFCESCGSNRCCGEQYCDRSGIPHCAYW